MDSFTSFMLFALIEVFPPVTYFMFNFTIESQTNNDESFWATSVTNFYFFCNNLYLINFTRDSFIAILLTNLKNTISDQSFSHLVVVDFESTCWENDKTKTQEISKNIFYYYFWSMLQSYVI